MSRDLEKQLREALRPVEPDEGFADRVAARIERERLEPRRRRYWLQLPAQFRWVSAALAVSAVLSVGAIVVHTRDLSHERQGLEARRQLIEALRVTGEKLDLAYRGVRDVSQPADPDDPGA